MVLTVDTAYEGDDTFSLVESIRSTAEEYYPGTWYLAGEGVSTYDLMDTVTADMVKVNLVAIGAVFVVLLFTMKSLIAPIILVLSIETAIWINLSIPYFSDQTIFYIAYLIISSIQLGATVDYAILMTTRYKAERLNGEDKKKAVMTALRTSAPSIIVSGMGLFAATFGVALYSNIDIVGSMCMLMARGAIISMLCVIFILPALLMLCDPLIRVTTLGMKSKNKVTEGK